MNRKIRRLLLTVPGILVMIAVLAIPTAVPVFAAHAVTVTLDPVASKPSVAGVTFNLKVTNDLGSANNIVEVKLDVPPPGTGGSNFVVDTISSPTGWTVAFTSDVNGNPETITWTTATDPIGANELETFTFVADTPSVVTSYNWEVTTKDDAAASVLTVVTTTVDDVLPTLDTVGWNDEDGSDTINLDDKIVFTFSEAIDQSTITAANIDTTLVPQRGFGTPTWGSDPTDLSWNTAGDVLTVTLAAGANLVTGQTVNPAASVTDIAGNADATVAQTLSATADASGSVTVLDDSDGDFITNGVSVGDLIDHDSGGVSPTVEILGANQLTTGTANASWNSADYTIHIGVTAISEADPPNLDSIAFNNIDGPGDTGFSDNDTIVLTFNEAVTGIDEATLDTDLPLSAGSWGTDGAGLTVGGQGSDTITVTLGSDFTFVSGATVDPAVTVVDLSGNGDATVTPVAIDDDEAPLLTSITFANVDTPNTGITATDTLAFLFSEAMKESTITDANLATTLPLSAGLYGTGATTSWSGDSKTLTVTLGTGTTILDGTRVNPDGTVTDAAGNSDNTSGLGGTINDNVNPTLLSVTWTDTDASGEIDATDTLKFVFSETMDESTVTVGDLNADFPTSGTGDYGTLGAGTSIAWTSASTVLTITLGTDTADLVADDTVNPDNAGVLDLAGNQDNTGGNGPPIVQVTLSLVADATTYVKGDVVTVSVEISNVDNFDAAGYTIVFDGNVLQAGTPSSGQIDTTVIDVVQNVVDTETLSTSKWSIVHNLANTTGVSGSGTLAILTFNFVGNSGEDTDISITSVSLSNTNATAISANITDTNVSSTLVLGDANGDGSVNILDVLQIEIDVANGLDIYTAPPGGTDEAAPGADANADTFLNALDITKTELLAGA